MLLHWVALFGGGFGVGTPSITEVDCSTLFSGPTTGRDVTSCLSGDPSTGANPGTCLYTTEDASVFPANPLFPTE